MILGRLQRSRTLATRPLGRGCMLPLSRSATSCGPFAARCRAIGQILPAPLNPAASGPPRARFRYYVSTGCPWHSAAPAVGIAAAALMRALSRERRHFGGKIMHNVHIVYIANSTNLAASRFYFLFVQSLLRSSAAALRGGTTRRARRHGRGRGGRGVQLAWDTSSPHPRA